jgi:hypothetical protein
MMGIKLSFFQGARHSSAKEAVERFGYDDLHEFFGHTRSATTKKCARMNTEGLKSVLRKK